MIHKSRNHLLEEILAAGGGAPLIPNLQQVVDEGNTTDKEIIILDPDGQQRAVIGLDTLYGLVLAARDASDNPQPVTLSGNTVFIASEQLAAIFNGSNSGDFLRLLGKVEIDGKDAFPIGSVPLDVEEYREEFSNSVDLALTNSFAPIISAATVNEYRAGSSQALSTFLIENTSSQAVEVEYYITVNDAAPTPDDLQTITIPKRVGGVDGRFSVSFSDTSTTLVNPADVVSVQVRQASGTPSSIVKGTIQTTTLTMVQNASIQNVVQSTEEVTTNGDLSDNKVYEITSGDTFTLPSAATKFSSGNQFAMYIKNKTGAMITIGNHPGDTTYTNKGPSAGFNMFDGESCFLVCSSVSNYDILSYYAAPQPVKVTTAERDAIISPQNGFPVFNTDSNENQYKTPEGWYCTKKASIGCGSTDVMVISSDVNAPSYITGFLGGFLGFEVEDQATGTFKNIMGRNVQSMTGTISFHPTETGGGTGTLQLFSEKCPAGADWTNQANWTINTISLRTIEVPANGESFATKVSFISNVADQSYFRFRMVETGAGGITLSPTSETILGQPITSASATFELTEQYTIN